MYLEPSSTRRQGIKPERLFPRRHGSEKSGLTYDKAGFTASVSAGTKHDQWPKGHSAVVLRRFVVSRNTCPRDTYRYNAVCISSGIGDPLAAARSVITIINSDVKHAGTNRSEARNRIGEKLQRCSRADTDTRAIVFHRVFHHPRVYLAVPNPNIGSDRGSSKAAARLIRACATLRVRDDAAAVFGRATVSKEREPSKEGTEREGTGGNSRDRED